MWCSLELIPRRGGARAFHFPGLAVWKQTFDFPGGDGLAGARSRCSSRL